MEAQRRPALVIRRKDLPKYVGKSLTQIDEMIVRGEFPPGTLVSDGGRNRIWFEDEIAAWQAARLDKAAPAEWLAKRDAKAASK